MIYLGIGLLLFLLIIGAPVGLALGISGLVGLYMAGGMDAVFGVMNTVPYRTAASYTLTTLPMFILMAELTSECGIVRELFDAAREMDGAASGRSRHREYFCGGGAWRPCPGRVPLRRRPCHGLRFRR